MSDDSTVLKKCTKCGEEKPATAEYFVIEQKNKSGIGAICKPCVALRTRLWTENNKEKKRDADRLYSKINRDKKRVRAREYYQENRERIIQKGRLYYQENKERALKSCRKYREAHREERAKYTREYRASHLREVRAKNKTWCKSNRAKMNEYNRRWAEAHPDKRRVTIECRRARKRNAEGQYTVADMHKQYKSQKGKCWHCGKKVKWEERHEDHLIPLARGGTNWPNNIVISCAQCNWSKSSKLPHEWNGKLF